MVRQDNHVQIANRQDHEWSLPITKAAFFQRCYWNSGSFRIIIITDYYPKVGWKRNLIILVAFLIENKNKKSPINFFEPYAMFFFLQFKINI